MTSYRFLQTMAPSLKDMFSKNNDLIVLVLVICETFICEKVKNTTSRPSTQYKVLSTLHPGVLISDLS